MKIAMCPGSFDPITNGHLDIIKRSAEIFDKVIVAVSLNSSKNHMFSVDERMDMVKSVVSNIPNVEVSTFTGLLVDYAKKQNANVIVKGLRAVSDFEYEFQMALINKKISGDIETMFMMTSQEYSYLSSSIVKEIATLGGDLSDLVPQNLIGTILEKFNN